MTSTSISGISPEQVLASAHGLSEMHFKVHVVNLWTLPAEELLATGDLGLIPWVPLAQFAGSPRVLLEKCRDRIVKEAPEQERENLLTVTRTSVEMRYNDVELLSLFGGNIMSFATAMLATPAGQRAIAAEVRKIEAKAIKAAAKEMAEANAKALEEIDAAAARKYIRRVLLARFAEIPKNLAAKLRPITDQKTLDKLVEVAAICDKLSTFEQTFDKS